MNRYEELKKKFGPEPGKRVRIVYPGGYHGLYGRITKFEDDQWEPKVHVLLEDGERTRWTKVSSLEVPPPNGLEVALKYANKTIKELNEAEKILELCKRALKEPRDQNLKNALTSPTERP